MPYVNYLRQGIYGSFESYRRDRYQADQAKATRSSGNFEGRITKTMETDTSKEVVLDDAVTITTIADRVRGKSKEIWNGLGRGCKIGFGVSLGGGLTSIAGGIAVGALLVPLWPVAIALGVVGLGALGFSSFNLVRMNQAIKQEAMWSDPVPAYQIQRRQAESKGYYHAYSSNYQGAVVSQDEFVQLWHKEMDQWADKYLAESPLLNQTKIANVRKFIEHSPLSKGAFSAAFANQDEAFLRNLSVRFETICKGYDQLKVQTDAHKANVNQEREQKKLLNDRQKEELLFPYQFMQVKIGVLQSRIEVLNSRIFQEETINVHTGTLIDHSGRVVPGRMVVRCAVSGRADLCRLEGELLRLQSMHAAMTAPIHALHLRNKQKIDAWAEGELSKLNKDEDDQVITFYPPIKKLLEDYKNRKIEDAEEAIESAFETGFTTEVPELEKKYTPEKWKPEWEEIIGEVDWENNILKQTVIYH